MAQIEKAIVVDAPVREVYQQWTQFEEFPRFMDGVVRRAAGRKPVRSVSWRVSSVEVRPIDEIHGHRSCIGGGQSPAPSDPGPRLFGRSPAKRNA